MRKFYKKTKKLITGFVGCLRELKINDQKLDPRVLLSTSTTREVSLDNCQLVDPCDRPNACEHGGLCMVDEGRVVCDCTGTGYTGKNCHFGTTFSSIFFKFFIFYFLFFIFYFFLFFFFIIFFYFIYFIF